MCNPIGMLSTARFDQSGFFEGETSTAQRSAATATRCIGTHKMATDSCKTDADKLRLEGNAFFKKGRYREAISIPRASN